MPIYEYACKKCDHRLDALQKIADAPLVDCPECGEPGLKRLLSAPRFRLKGEGWYETDFKKDNQRNLHGEKAPSKSKDTAATDKSDDKAKPKPSSDKKASKA
ncbi:MAG: zinc ribbon domain-containing protein [Gammaproteobacteria bacterium]|jgi:putative FmdB family regulatory protein|nr:zinc ribbon domain-containing protein [Gammaproteobacteria bacterium]MDH3750889.1 zinc ribbon domain-containing protein [Gammaproteobacteria bacterium]MDH3805189.1 zinc ribbon domain-containing protein [Gammaproteobacteria bacterium]